MTIVSNSFLIKIADSHGV